MLFVGSVQPLSQRLPSRLIVAQVSTGIEEQYRSVRAGGHTRNPNDLASQTESHLDVAHIESTRRNDVEVAKP